MDAAEEEQDVKLQRASADLLADFQTSIHAFLWKTTTTGKVRVRRRVRVRETDRLVALLEPFQELPQLLDPHLEKFLPVISDAFLACLHSKPSGNSETHSQLLEPLSRSICRLLYTFCKIRGEKVVVRFLSTETKHLEVLLSAIEEGTEDKDTVPNVDSKSDPEAPNVWSWEERYITLLWLSHLLLAPFDLSTISSLGTGKSLDTNIAGLAWPEKVPGVTLRVVPLAVRYLSSAGKERDAAKVLLVRVAMRKDMQELGIMDALVRWAVSRLRPSDDTSLSTYYYVGILSFLAGILNSSVGTADMESYVASIFHVVEDISNADELTFKNIRSSAVARKLIIKILRTITVHLLQNPGTMVSAEMVENTIGHMLEAVADTATPVRLAASKALSVITLKLAPDMAAQVVEAVLDALKQNVLWVKRDYASEPRRDLSAINPLEWHGLTLTLSHLLYRRSPPADSLVDIIPALLTALTFEQRSSSGSSIGTNVRDAACFGIWALARRYSTAELHAVPIHSIPGVNGDNETGVTQLLATELVVCASLDPAGNIRRGASAALQELIGRHPDTVEEGISVVQVVDYHAVALRSRAINEVASGAAKLSDFYLNGLIDGLLGWRGVGDADDSTRRTAAAAVGDLVNLPALKLPQRRDFSAKDMKSEVQHLPQSNKLSSFDEPWARFDIMSCRIENQIRELKQREVDERHGLLLCLASLIAHISTADSTTSKPQSPSDPKPIQERFFKFANEIIHDDTRYRRPELVAESVCRLITSALPFSYIDIDMAEKLLDEWLHRNEAEVIDAASEAASKLFSLYEDKERQMSIMKFVGVISEGHGNRTGKDKGFIYALWNAFPLANAATKDAIKRAMHTRWNSGHGIETRATILRCLAIGEVLDSDTLEFVDIIAEGLDDYTTDARGDIGSVVRIAAVRAAARMWKNTSSPEKQQSISKMFGKVLRLATEKLDKVRMEAQAAVLCICRERSAFELLPASSYEYFSFILHMQTDAALTTIPQEPQWLTEMLEGYVSSADTGSEDLVRVSRAALADFCEEKSNTDLVCLALFEVLKKNIVNDRILVPTLEVMGFLFDAGILQRSSLEWRKVYTWVQKSHYKTGSVRKLEAAIKMYGSLVEVYPEALQKLTGMLLHPFPKVRNQVADTLFVVRGVGKGVDWGKAGKTDLERLKRQLGL